MRMLPAPLLMLAALVIAIPDPAQACGGPQVLEALIQQADHVALVRVAARHQVKEVRAVEYEVVHSFRGDPPARFLLVDPVEPEPPGPGQPTASEWAVLFLMDEGFVSAPWGTWQDLSRLAADTPVLGVIHLEPVLASQGQLGVVSDVLVEPPFLLELLDVEPPPPAWMPLDAYTDAIERKAERVRDQPAAR